MIEDRDGTVHALSLLVVSIVFLGRKIVPTTRIESPILRDSTIPLLDTHTMQLCIHFPPTVGVARTSIVAV